LEDPDSPERQPGRAGPPSGEAQGESVPVRYKVVEVSPVTDQALEDVLNEWTGKGWTLHGVQFAMREASPRPAMAFVTLTREDDQRDSA
jgi:hypothetical protein